MESNVTPENKNQTEYQPGHCNPMKPPSIGTLTLAAGNGTNVGTVMTLWCPLLHRASSGGLIKCEQDSNGTHWTGGIPECKKIEHQDFHLAVLLSIISTGIIIIMSVYFITSCLLNCVKKEEARQLDRALERENARLWKQLNEEEQRDHFYNHNGRIINNNNNNSNQEQHSRVRLSLMSEPVVTVARKNSPRWHKEGTLRGTRLKREPILIWVAPNVHLLQINDVEGCSNGDQKQTVVLSLCRRLLTLTTV